MSEAFSGRFVVGEDGRLEEDPGAHEIYRRLKDMKLLAASGRVPDFYFDPGTNSYWEHLEFEDGQVSLRRVERSWIAQNWPSVRFDELLTVDRPGD